MMPPVFVSKGADIEGVIVTVATCEAAPGDVAPYGRT